MFIQITAFDVIIDTGAFVMFSFTYLLQALQIYAAPYTLILLHFKKIIVENFNFFIGDAHSLDPFFHLRSIQKQFLIRVSFHFLLKSIHVL